MQSDYYLKFENKFRGDRNSIIEKLSSYDSLIDLIISQNKNVNLLDIGCGRGEWLERCRNKIPDSFGIEIDQNMLRLCRNNNLKVYEGDALKILSQFKDESISIITIFHVIEHLDNSKLSELIVECQRVLKENGVLIMETPSIDNLLVSTKLFYLDSTHINHINPDSLSFFLEYLGFDKVEYFFINGGPLQKADFQKLTRVLNGVGQDLLFIVSKNKKISNLIFNQNIEWKSNINIAPSTLESAVDFDLERERAYKEIIDSNEEIINSNLEKDKLYEINHMENIKRMNDLSSELHQLLESFNILRNELKYFLKILKLAKKIVKLLAIVPRKIIRIIFSVFKKLIRKIFQYGPLNAMITSKKTLYFMTLFFRNTPGNHSKLMNTKITNKLNYQKKIDINSSKFNDQLLSNYENSSKSKAIRRRLNIQSTKIK